MCRQGHFPRNTRRRARARHGVFGMTSKDWIERMVTARLAEHDERVRVRRAGKAASSAKWHAVVLARERATEERAQTPRASEQALWCPDEGRAAMQAQGPRQGRALPEPWRHEHRP